MKKNPKSIVAVARRTARLNAVLAGFHIAKPYSLKELNRTARSYNSHYCCLMKRWCSYWKLSHCNECSGFVQQAVFACYSLCCSVAVVICMCGCAIISSPTLLLLQLLLLHV